MRDKLITENMDFVKKIAYKFKYHDRDDLIAAGYVALIKAADNYDGLRDFKGYAYVRVHGAMIDEMRRMGNSTRSGKHRNYVDTSTFIDLKSEHFAQEVIDFKILLESLPTLEQEILINHYMGEECLKDIGNRLGKHSVDMWRAKKKLIKAIDL